MPCGLTPRTTLSEIPGSRATKLILPPHPGLLPVVPDHFSLASTAALPRQKEMKVMASVVSGTSKEILKEVRKKFRILPDDLRNFLPFLSTLRFLHSHQGNSLVMGPQASCLPYNSDPSFPCPQTDYGFPVCIQSSPAPQPDPLGSAFIYFSTFTFIPHCTPQALCIWTNYFTLNITGCSALKTFALAIQSIWNIPIFQAHFKYFLPDPSSLSLLCVGSLVSPRSHSSQR